MDKDRLNDIFNEASEAVLVFNSKGELLYVNSAAQGLFQYTYVELEDKNLLSLIEEDIREEIQSFLQERDTPLSGHIMEQKAYILSKTQQQIPASLLFSTITHDSGNIHMLVVEPMLTVVNNISSDYKLLANSLPDTVSLYDAQQQCLYVNPAVRKLYGYRPAEYQLMGGFFSLIAKEVRAGILKKIEEDTQHKVHVSSYTYQANSSQGDSRQVEAKVRRVFDEQGQLQRLFVFEKSLMLVAKEATKETTAKKFPLIFLDGDWRVTYLNEEAVSVLGHTPTKQGTFFDLLHPDDINQALLEEEGRIPNGIISSERYLNLRSPDGYLRFRVVFDKFFDTGGQLAYVTVRLYRPHEDENIHLGHSQYLKLMAEHVGEIICFFRPDFSLDYISPSVRQTLGYDNESLTGSLLFDLIHPEDQTEAQAFLRQNSTDNSRQFSCRFRKADGTYLRLELDLRMLESSPKDSGVLPFLALFRHMPHLRDIGNPVNLFAELSKHLTDASAVVALSSLRIQQFNQHFLDIFNVSEENLKDESVFSLFESSSALEQLEKNLQEAKKPFHKDMRCLPSQQKPFWANVAVSFFESEGENYAFMRITDISEQKEREKQLQEARDEAENMLKNREEFFSTMSHEIRTPLNAILGMTHLMLQGKPREDQIKLLQTLKFSGDSLTALINDVLDFSKIEAGKLQFARDDFNLREFLNNIRLTYKDQARDKGLVFRTLLEEELPNIVSGDVHRLGQILNNLLNNAIKFTEDGYVILSIYMEAEEEDHYVILFEVSDTGIGIPREKQEAIFDPYQQASEHTSRYFGGTGLGLSIVKKLVELSNGEIILKSEEGQGTTFKVKLKFPIPTGGQAVSEQSDRSFIHDFQPLDGLKVLYVEDVIPNQFLMEGLCDTWHIELDTALSGLEALEKVKNNHYDLILMDIYMPGMDGFEAAQEIRKLQEPHYSQVPILALSASISEQTQQRIIEKGMNDYISKPINPRTLHQKLSQYAPVVSTTTAEGEALAWEEAVPLETIHPDTPDFSQLQELYADDREGYTSILKQVYKLSEESAEAMIQALQQGHMETFRSSAHKIMSYIRLMKLQGLQELLDKIKGHFEDHSRSPKTAAYMLDVHFGHLMKNLEKEIRQYS